MVDSGFNHQTYITLGGDPFADSYTFQLKHALRRLIRHAGAAMIA